MRTFSLGLFLLSIQLQTVPSASAETLTEPGDEETQQEEPEYFEESEPRFSMATVWDFRFVHTDETASWLDAGLGKTRYGGDRDGARSLFRIPQASVVVGARPASFLDLHVHANLDLEPEHPEGRFGWDRLGLIEAYATATASFGETWEGRLRAGLYFPPISLEHIGEAWSTFYTLTPSAINAWVGEEVRALGVEPALARVGASSEVVLRGSWFVNNDPTGSLLAYRGFAIHDRQVGLQDRVPLAPIASIAAGGPFDRQAPWTEPVSEIDGRSSYYGALSYESYQYFRVSALYFDTRGRPDAFESGQYAWQTRFSHAGLVLFLPRDAELVGQFMSGDTLMGFEPPGPRIRADFRSWYLMGSIPFGRHRVSLRYEDFRTWDRDRFREPDPGDERGDAWTAAYWMTLGGPASLGAELMRVVSDRPARTTIGVPAVAEELLFQLNLRLQF